MRTRIIILCSGMREDEGSNRRMKKLMCGHREIIEVRRGGGTE